MENITSKGTIFGTLIAQAGPKGDTGKTGDRGLTGEAGYSPIKGVDYFTQEDISEIRKGIEGDLTGEYNKNAIEKTNIFNTNAKETTTSFDLNAENKTKEYNDNALAEIEKYNSNAIEKSNNFDTNFENKTSKFDSNCDEKTKEFNDNNDLGIQNYNNNAKKQMEIFDTNFTEKLEAFNNNAGNKFNGFNTNSDKALAEYNKNHTAKMKEFDDNYDTKTKTFDDNAAAKLDEYNENDKTKTDAYNNNASNKEETFNTNAADKQNEFDENASDKLAEYNQNAKELINKVEQVQAENETLKAENKLIKEQIPSANASGNSIHIEDSGSLDFDWKIKDGHRQETREGYNLLDTSNVEEKEYDGIRVTRNSDGSIKFKGTATKDFAFTYSFEKVLNGTYQESMQVIGTINDSTGFISSTIWNGGTNLFGDLMLKSNSTQILNKTFAENTNITHAMFYVATGAVLDCTIYPLLYKFDGTTKPYEQYGVSPSPGYPSEVETVGSNVNFIPTNPDEWEQGSISNGKNISSTTRIRSKGFIDIVEGEDYYLSIQDNQYRFVNIVLYKDDNTYLNVYSSYDIAIKKEYFLKVNFPTGCKKIRFVIRKVDDTSSIIPSEIDVIKPKLEKGTVQTPWSPYNQGSVEIDVVNENILKLDNYLSADVRNEVNSVSKSDNDLTLNFNAGADAFVGTLTDKGLKIQSKYEKLLIPIKQQITYNISCDTGFPKCSITYYDKYFTSLGWEEISPKGYNKSNKDFVTYAECKYIGLRLGIQNNDYTSYTFKNLEIKEGSGTSTPLSHQSQTAIMPIQQEMLEGDYIAGVEHHEWEKLVLDENSDIECVHSNTAFQFRFLKYLEGTGSTTKTLCNMAKYWNIGAWEENRCFVSWNGYFYILCKENEFGFNADMSTDEALAHFKAILADNKLIAYYQLSEPLDLPLTEEQKAVRNQKLYTYKNITNIAVSDELASIDVTYKKDLETEHNKLQKEIDEIKQLISTTQTSALLLDNLQKDVECEVE